MIEVHEVEGILSDELYLKTSEFGLEATVEISSSSMNDAAAAIVDTVNERLKDDIVTVKLRTKMRDLEANAHTKLESSYTQDWLQAYTDMRVASAIKNVLDEVGA